MRLGWRSLDSKYLGALLADNCIKISNSCFALTKVILNSIRKMKAAQPRLDEPCRVREALIPCNGTIRPMVIDKIQPNCYPLVWHKRLFGLDVLGAPAWVSMLQAP